MSFDKKELAGMIDHTLLNPDTTPSQIEPLCEQAMANNFCSVCILPSYVSLATALLKDSDVKVCTVIGFPLGATESQVKSFETNLAIEQGADEIDMVINIGALKSDNIEYLLYDMAVVVEMAKGKTVKVILETCLLDDEEKVKACHAAIKAGVDFVKTSTGFSKNGATINDIRLMRKTVGPDMGVKASGGVRDYGTACSMVEAGANRLGTSSGLKIIGVEDNKEDSGY